MTIDFEEFVALREQALLRFAYLLAGDRHLAEDLTQEALIHTHRRWRFIERGEQPEPYVRAAIVRQFLSWRRRKSTTEVVLADLPERPDSDEFVERSENRDEVWRMLQVLSRRQRAVIILRYYEDMADQDIAATLECSVATVRVHAFKAMGRLRAVCVAQPSMQETAK